MVSNSLDYWLVLLVFGWLLVHFRLIFGRLQTWANPRARPRFVSGHIRCLGRAAEFCCPCWCPGQCYQVLVVAVNFRGDLAGWVVGRLVRRSVGWWVNRCDCCTDCCGMFWGDLFGAPWALLLLARHHFFPGISQASK